MKKKGFTLVELLVVIAIIALLMGILMPALARVRQIAFRMVCGTNLSGIGKAMLIYANDYDDEMPRAGGRSSSWALQIPNFAGATRYAAYGMSSDGSGGTVTITSSFYLLVKYAEVTPKSFLCKGDSGVTEFESAGDVDLTDLWDFGGNGEAASHCSYSYNQPYCNYALTTSSEPGMAIAADPNPWLDPDAEGLRNFANFKVTGGKEFTKLGNTITHQDEGQNVLFLDSHVDFSSVSFCGINEDNIYTQALAADPRRGTVPSSGGFLPLNRSDNLLVIDGGTSSGGADKGRSCFLGDTQVWVNGQMVAISDVTAGENIEKLDVHTGTFTVRDIVLANGNTISVAENHYFMLDSGIWVKSVDLRSGMTLRTQNGSIDIQSVSVRENAFTGNVYNVKVLNAEQYNVGQDGLVVRDW